MAEVLEKIPTEVLLEIFKDKGIESEKRIPSRETMVEAFEAQIQEECIKQFVYIMRKKDVKEWTKKIKQRVLATHNNNTNSSNVLKKRLYEHLEKNGITTYVQNVNPSERLLVRTLKNMGISAEKSDGKEKLRETLMSEVQMAGIESFMGSFTVKQLKDIVKKMNLTVPSNSPNILIDCILNDQDYIPETRIIKKKKVETEEEKKKKEFPNLHPLLERVDWAAIKELDSWSVDEDKSGGEWIDKEKLKDIPFVDEVTPEKMPKKGKRRIQSRKVREGVNYFELLLDAVDEKDKKKKDEEKDKKKKEKDNGDEKDGKKKGKGKKGKKKKEEEAESSESDYEKTVAKRKAQEALFDDDEPKKKKKKHRDDDKNKKRMHKKHSSEEKDRKKKKRDEEGKTEKSEDKHKKHKKKHKNEESEGKSTKHDSKEEDSTEKKNKKDKEKHKNEESEGKKTKGALEEEPTDKKNKKDKKKHINEESEGKSTKAEESTDKKNKKDKKKHNNEESEGKSTKADSEEESTDKKKKDKKKT